MTVVSATFFFSFFFSFFELFDSFGLVELELLANNGVEQHWYVLMMINKRKTAKTFMYLAIT